MKKVLTFLLLIVNFLCADSQSLPCGSSRFITREFSSVTVTSNILFGNNTTFAGSSKNLFMDIYEPAGDVSIIRPLIIFAFGGGFLTGDRTQLARLCDSMAGKGYVAAAIDYRLYDNPAGILGFVTNPNHAIDAMSKAVSDFKAAIRYFKRDAATVNTYRIDTNFVIIGGISSGSIAALHTAYINTLNETSPPVSTIIMQNGGLEGNTDLPLTPLIGTYTYSGIKGVWNMSGALFDSGYIKTGDAALFGIHGTADAIVPHGYGRLYGTAGYVCGSSTLYNQAINVGVPASFISVQGGGHTSFYTDTPTVMKLDSTASRFFANILCPTVLAVSGAILNGNIVNGQVKLSWQTLSENASKGFAVEKQSPLGWLNLGGVNSKSVNGYSSSPLYYTFTDIQPDNGENLYRLKFISLQGEIVYSKTIRISWNGKPAGLFVIYPNPVGSILRYKTSLTPTGLNLLKIYSADMRLVQTHRLNATQALSIPGLPGGLYLGVVWDSKNRQTASSWFIKR